ncbi:hypothetical protein CCACVL1_17791 [Corchorus capsularis]|uniref:Uncharacterized protein n=1 Tax=Corchorus capsularis TaxID=210143 RepID=A0A1R3HQM3_COCAP|nr:hypothetical protein CCACVL1_17791 [Corchorus capsularis]
MSEDSPDLYSKYKHTPSHARAQSHWLWPRLSSHASIHPPSMI